MVRIGSSQGPGSIWNINAPQGPSPLPIKDPLTVSPVSGPGLVEEESEWARRERLTAQAREHMQKPGLEALKTPGKEQSPDLDRLALHHGALQLQGSQSDDLHDGLVVFSRPQHRTARQLECFPLMPQAETLMHLLNEYRKAEDSKYFGLPGLLRNTAIALGIHSESALPPGKRSGSLQKSAFLIDVEEQVGSGAARFFRPISSNENEIQVSVLAGVAVGTDENIAGFFKAGKPPAGLAYKDMLAAVEQARKSSEHGIYEQVWLPATVVRQLLQLPQRVAENLVIAASLAAKAHQEGELKKHASMGHKPYINTAY